MEKETSPKEIRPPEQKAASIYDKWKNTEIIVYINGQSETDWEVIGVSTIPDVTITVRKKLPQGERNQSKLFPYKKFLEMQKKSSE